MRPKQWVKNVLVGAAPLAAGKLFEVPVLTGVILAFVAFCLVSASVYLVNDVRDIAEDRLHPRKRFRPIAAGELKPSTALLLAALTGQNVQANKAIVGEESLRTHAGFKGQAVAPDFEAHHDLFH